MATVGREHPTSSKRLHSRERSSSGKKERVGILDSIEDSENAVKNHGLTFLVYGPEGVGKSSLFAYAESPIFLVGQQEHGIHKLKRAHLVPEDVAVPRDIKHWYDLLKSLDELATADHDFKFLALDSLTVFQQMCFHTCCEEQYEGDYSKEGFLSFMQGPRTAALHYWPSLLSKLDTLRESGMNIGLTAHSNIAPYKNPTGPDYDRFVADLSNPIWKSTARWCDAVLFLNHATDADKDGKYSKFKGSGGEQRLIHTEFCATFDAKNRFKLPSVLGPYNNAEETWGGLWGAIQKSLRGNQVRKENRRRS